MTSNTQCMVVLRHALRLDEVNHDFVTSSKACWDPPLATAGFEQVQCLSVANKLPDSATSCSTSSRPLQAKAVSKELQPFEINTIVASPFQRCLETADTVFKAWNNNLDAWHVDCKLCEVVHLTLCSSAKHLLVHCRHLALQVPPS